MGSEPRSQKSSEHPETAAGCKGSPGGWINHIPYDLLYAIFNKLDYASSRRSKRVCRLWKDVIESLPDKVMYWDCGLMANHEPERRYRRDWMEKLFQHSPLGINVEHLTFNGNYVEATNSMGPIHLLQSCYSVSRFPKLRKLTVEKLCIIYVDDRLERIFKMIPPHVQWEIQLTEDAMRLTWRDFDRHSTFPRILMPYIRGNGGDDGHRALREATDKLLPTVGADLEPLVMRMFPRMNREYVQGFFQWAESESRHYDTLPVVGVTDMTIKTFRCLVPSTKWFLIAEACFLASDDEVPDPSTSMSCGFSVQKKNPCDDRRYQEEWKEYPIYRAHEQYFD